MDSEDVVFHWTPNREPYEMHPYRGQIAATTLEAPGEARNHQHSMGACDSGWKSLGEDDRKARVKGYMKQWILEDNIPVEDIQSELKKVAGWERYPLGF